MKFLSAIFKIVVFFLVTGSPLANAQVTLEGDVNNIFKNKIISICSYSDFITEKDTVLAKTKDDSTGHFKVRFPLDRTRLIWVNYGRIRAKFFAEKDKYYKLLFPEYQKITIADSLNPYFEPEAYWLGIDDTTTNELNRQILRFLTLYNNLLTNNFYLILQKGYHIQLDTFYNKIDSIFGKINNPFLQNYITYKLAYLKFMSVKRDMRYITWHYFTHKPILYQNPAYMALFNGLYREFFQYYYNTPKGQAIYSDIAEGKSPALIMKTLQNRYEMQDDSLAEFVMLRGLFDGAYSSKLASFSYFPRKQIVMTLDSIILLSAIPQHRQIAKRIKQRIKDDFFTPKDSLKSLVFYDIADEKMTFDNFKGKYSYVIFCDINNLPCQENFALIQKLFIKYKNTLHIIPIFVSSQKKAAESYFTTNNLSFPYYFIKNISELKNLRINVLPSFILIDPYGKIIRNPAHSPMEDFEHHFIKILRSRN